MIPLFRRHLLKLAVIGLIFAARVPVQAASLADTREIAKEAYIYAFAMMENYQTIYKQAIDSSDPAYVGGFGKFRHYSEPFTPANHDVVTPNNDTPYSWAWLDLRAEPWVVSVPAVPKSRYYVMQWIDLFTQNFAYIGVRATGFGAGHYMIAGPGWHGTKPPKIDKVFRAETDIVGTLTRTSLAGPDDVPALKALQAQYKLEPLSRSLGTAAPPSPPKLNFPVFVKVDTQDHNFIRYLNFFLQLAEPPIPAEVALRNRFAEIGIGPGKPWDPQKVKPAVLKAIDQGVADGQRTIQEKLAHTFDSNGLFGSRAQLGTDYLTRDAAAAKGLYGNSLEEAWYGGYVGDGAKAMTIHFDAGKLPPAKFFWSLTLYTLPDRFLYANQISRYSIGSHTGGLIYNADHSLTLYISHASPGGAKNANWLPAPEGKYSVVARIYGPEKALLDKSWTLPKLEAEQ